MSNLTETDIQALQDLLAAYHGLTLGRQDTEWEGQIKLKAKQAINKLKEENQGHNMRHVGTCRMA